MTQEGSSSGAASDLVVVLSNDSSTELLSIVISTLPVNFPAPIVIAHGSAYPQRMKQIQGFLQAPTTAHIELVTKRTQLEPGSVYIVPLNQNISIGPGIITVEDRPAPQFDSQATSFLSLLATIYGDRLIAVPLIDLSLDGLAGALEVKAAGGVVIVPNINNGFFRQRATPIPPGLNDFEAEPEQITALAQSLIQQTTAAADEQQKATTLQEILQQINHQANLDFRSYKPSTMLRRISRRMIITHQQSMADYLHFIQDNPMEVGELAQAFLINVTHFFRDTEAFTYLEEEILPAIINTARKRDRVLRFWSAGCATGEEPYSLAMILAHALGAELPEWSIKIFATDLDEAAINFARVGIYPEHLLRSTPEEYRDRYFERTSQGYRIAKMLRQMVIFGHQNLSRSAPFPRINLVMCRNVLIYFTPDLQDYVLRQFAFSLESSHGVLFLGKAENVRPQHTYYEVVHKQWKVYRRTAEVVPMSRRQGGLNPVLSRGQLRPMLPPGPETASSESGSSGMALDQLRRFNELLLRFLPVGVVVIDRGYRLMSANAAARRLLGLHETAPEQDFLHSVRGIPYADMRQAIDQVFRDRTPATPAEVELSTRAGGNGRYLLMTIVPLQVDPRMPDLAAICLSDVTDQVQTRQHLEAAQTEQAQLLQELSMANKRLNDLNKELIDANEELQVSNEEMLSTYEELQATNEEFEATNEELQATNEELETNNEELQATNEELQTTNEELRARTAELQDLATMLETERSRLAEMVELAPVYIIVLQGPDLLIEAFNPRYARLVEHRKIYNRPLREIADMFWKDQQVVELANEAFQRDEVLVSPRLQGYVPNAYGELLERYFTFTIVPTHEARGKVLGVVVYGVEERDQEEK